MLTQEIINKLAEIAKIDAKTLSDAIASDTEATIEFPEVSVFTTEELERRDANIQRESHQSGKAAGVEVLIKELKKEHGIEMEGKDARKFLDAFKAKTLADANVKPGEKDAETERIIAGLKTRNTELEDEVTTLKETISTSNIRTKAFSAVTKDYTLSKDKVLHLMGADGYTLAEEEGAIVFKRNGNIERDPKTQDPLPVDSVFDSYAAANNLLKTEEPGRKGRGGGSSKHNLDSATKLSELQKQWEEEGKSPNGAEFMAKAMELSKDNPDFFNE